MNRNWYFQLGVCFVIVIGVRLLVSAFLFNSFSAIGLGISGIFLFLAAWLIYKYR